MSFTRMLRPAARRSIGLAVALTLLTVPAVALANHQFNDVTNANIFHADIDAIAEAGIATGFPDGGFHPSEAVTRQAMAAFMRRGFGRVVLEDGADSLPSVSVAAGAGGSAEVVVYQAALIVPGADSAFDPHQFVYVQGRVGFFTSMSLSKGCPCQFGAYIREIGSDLVSDIRGQTFESTTTNAFVYSLDVEALFRPDPGSHTYQLEVYLVARNSATNAATFNLDANTSSLTAMSFPFGPLGTNNF